MATNFGAVNLRHRHFPKPVLTAAVLATTLPIWPPAPLFVQVPTPTALAYNIQWQGPPAHLHVQRSVDTLYDFAWTPTSSVQFVAEYGFHNQHHVHSPKERNVALLTGTAWAPRDDLVVAGLVTTEMWHKPWEVPRAHLAAKPREEGYNIWPAQVAQVEYQDGWQSLFPPPRDLSPQPRLPGNVAWPGFGYSFVQAPTPSDLAHIQWQDPPALFKVKPRLEGATIWAARAPFVEYQDGWRSLFSTPQRLSHKPRLQGANTWPGFGFFFTQVQTGTDFDFETRWQDPPKRKPSSVDNLGDSAIWSPRVADVQFQDGWRSSFPTPSAHLEARPRPQGSIAWPARVARIEFQDGWRAEFHRPPAHLRALHGRVPDWQPFVTTFEVQTATPSEWWQVRWTDPPNVKPRSVALRDGYSIDWIFHGGTVTPTGPPVKHMLLFIEDNTIELEIDVSLGVSVQALEPIRILVDAVNFNLVVSSMTPDPSLDP